MAAKKKKSTRRRSMRGLGLSPSEHTEYADRENTAALTAAKYAAYGASCDARVHHAVRAITHLAKTEAHLESGGSLRQESRRQMSNLRSRMMDVISRCRG